MATNYLGPFLLTMLLLPSLQRSASKVSNPPIIRIITITITVTVLIIITVITKTIVIIIRIAIIIIITIVITALSSS